MAAQHTENDATIARGLAAAAAVREGGPVPLARALTARTEHAVAEAVRTHDLALKMHGAAATAEDLALEVERGVHGAAHRTRGPRRFISIKPCLLSREVFADILGAAPANTT